MQMQDHVSKVVVPLLQKHAKVVNAAGSTLEYLLDQAPNTVESPHGVSHAGLCFIKGVQRS